MTQRWGQLRPYVSVIPDADTRFPALDRDAAKAKRAITPKLRQRMVVDGERTYSAYSADELLEIESQADRSRPGHLY